MSFRVSVIVKDRIFTLSQDVHSVSLFQDIHSVSSLLKMYFRELPNPVCTFHLYDKVGKIGEREREREREKYILFYGDN